MTVRRGVEFVFQTWIISHCGVTSEGVEEHWEQDDTEMDKVHGIFSP